MSEKIAFDNVRLIDPQSGLDAIGYLVVQSGRIVTRGEGPLPEALEGAAGVERVEGRGRCLMPALVDLRSHWREPGYEDSETIASGSAAAAAGGFTDVLVLPNTKPRVETAAAVANLLDRAARVGMCRAHVAAALTADLQGERMVEYGDLFDAGALAFTDDMNWVRDGGLMRHAMESIRALDALVISHPEDASLSRNGVMHEGTWSTRLGLAGLPVAAEVSAIARDLELARLTGARLHIPHVSCRASVRLIRAARDQGLPVTAEATVHHLCFTDADCRDYDTNFKVKPPLRSSDDQAALVEALADGTLDAIASDHAPHTRTDKERTFAHAPFGVIGLETALAAAHDRLVVQGSLDLLRLVELMSAAPARILGLEPKGLGEGAAADLVLFDPADRWAPSAGALRSKGANCPWLGRTLVGRVHGTWLEGRRTFSVDRLNEVEAAV